MISLDEFNACIKREEIIFNNSSNPEERFMAMNIINAIGRAYSQLEAFSKSPDFKEMVNEFKQAEEAKNTEEDSTLSSTDTTNEDKK